MPTFSEMHTPNGHTCGDSASALQKAIRRGEEREALYFASELDLAGYGNYVWKRLRIIASEDVGLADPHAACTVRALYENWQEQRKADKDRPQAHNAELFLIHAVCLLTRARKSRLVDHALMVFYETEPREQLLIEVPDYAYDKHTSTGRKLGRGEAHFFDEAALLVNSCNGDGPYVDDPYAAEGRAVRDPGYAAAIAS